MSDDFATVTEALGELSTYGDHADKHPMDHPAYLALVRIEARVAEAERQRDIAIHNAETVARNATTSGEAQRRRIAHLEGALREILDSHGTFSEDWYEEMASHSRRYLTDTESDVFIPGKGLVSEYVTQPTDKKAL